MSMMKMTLMPQSSLTQQKLWAYINMLYTQCTSQITYWTWCLLNYITQIQINDLSCGSFLSDHCTVDFITTIPRDGPKTNTIPYRKLKNINPEDMLKDIEAMQDMIQDEDLTDIINSLESGLKDALDKHAPAITKILTTRKSNPWFTEEVRSQKRLLRKMERTYCRYRTNTSWQKFRIQKQIYRGMLKKAKTDSVSTKVMECGNDTKNFIKLLITF